MFFKGSRYADVEEHEITVGGRTVRYKRIRFIPPTGATVLHTVNQGERLDHIAFACYQNAERFWRICDANKATWPDDLIDEPGRTLLIPPAED